MMKIRVKMNLRMTDRGIIISQHYFAPTINHVCRIPNLSKAMSFAVGLKSSWGKIWLILIFGLHDELVKVTITTST